ncbi:MAG: hypothetical protein A2W93_11175 [Bacteroidetes bacterium GWF2_43_63]|nr:MAG: hypothetical protein A2W94_14050 [Bacteroidetes bacterium GWE2_42_42]OFY54836.1 MAG: hypothetical protein A2W93_11175 [Bacteroidetes bacterium GWF2_43_63]HCB63262.1 hypothetical protein [Bacteroidales bacterium]HCY22004.1 hypothetical protein [Bacteroidales bacterium]
MHAYKFRITSDENDEFLREIDVLANQTFEDFHKCLVRTCKLAGNELASFYLCDNQWRKRREITLVDMSMDDDEEKSAESNIIMKDGKLNQVINDPHQKLIYVYDYLSMYTLYIELMKIGTADLTMHFPLISKEISDIIAPPSKINKILEEEEVVFDEDELVGSAEEKEEDDENLTEEQFYNDDSAEV